MENKIIKQKPEQFLTDTFKDTINYYGTKNAYAIARKLYIKTNNIITSIEFLGPTNMAFNNLVLTAIGKNGPIEQSVIPLSMIFRESKISGGSEKLVSFKIALNVTGEYTYVWSVPVTDEDIMALNNTAIQFIELFSQLGK